MPLNEKAWVDIVRRETHPKELPQSAQACREAFPIYHDVLWNSMEKAKLRIEREGRGREIISTLNPKDITFHPGKEMAYPPIAEKIVYFLPNEDITK